MLAFRFGPANQQLYGCLHQPAAGVSRQHGVLLCNPFGQEAIRGQRLVRILAERLSRQGFHVLRFDYFGTGDSDGDDTEGSLEQWARDIQLADLELRRRVGSAPVSWVGFRLGATLAAIASRSATIAPERLVLWEPVVNGSAYIEEMHTAHLQVLKLDYLSRWVDGSQFAQFIGSTAGSEVLGYPMTAQLRTAFSAISPVAIADARAGRGFVFDIKGSAGCAMGVGNNFRRTAIDGAIEWATIEAPSSAIVSNEGISLIMDCLVEAV